MVDMKFWKLYDIRITPYSGVFGVADYEFQIGFLKSTTSSLREYTESQTFNSDFSSIKHQIAFLAPLSLYKSGTNFRMPPISNQSVDLIVLSPPETVRFSYRKCLMFCSSHWVLARVSMQRQSMS